MSSNPLNTNQHIIIVGAGMVGAALALALADNNFQVTLIEHSSEPKATDENNIELRVSAISEASLNFFKALNVWNDINKHRAYPYLQMHVWDQKGFGEIHFDAEESGVDQLGHIIENNTIQHSLWLRANKHENIKILCPASVETLNIDEQPVKLTLNNKTELTANLIIAADGANSQLRTLANINSPSRAYNQKGVVATLKTEHGTQSAAWQRFMPSGPLALLPIADDLFSIVWSAEDDFAEELLALSDDAFNQVVTEASENRLGELKLISKRAAFPLNRAHADQYIKPGFALVGDAAHVVHPLAGQGVNLGLLDAATLADVLITARDNKKLISSLTTLRRYERTRKGDNLITQYTMDGFKHLFSNDNGPLKLLRNIGLAATNKINPIKQFFAQSGMRDYEDLPTLMRPKL